MYVAAPPNCRGLGIRARVVTGELRCFARLLPYASGRISSDRCDGGHRRRGILCALLPTPVGFPGGRSCGGCVSFCVGLFPGALASQRQARKAIGATRHEAPGAQAAASAISPIAPTRPSIIARNTRRVSPPRPISAIAGARDISYPIQRRSHAPVWAVGLGGWGYGRAVPGISDVRMRNPRPRSREPGSAHHVSLSPRLRTPQGK